MWLLDQLRVDMFCLSYLLTPLTVFCRTLFLQSCKTTLLHFVFFELSLCNWYLQKAMNGTILEQNEHLLQCSLPTSTERICWKEMEDDFLVIMENKPRVKTEDEQDPFGWRKWLQLICVSQPSCFLSHITQPQHPHKHIKTPVPFCAILPLALNRCMCIPLKFTLLQCFNMKVYV